jgi:hypothetical protein
LGEPVELFVFVCVCTLSEAELLQVFSEVFQKGTLFLLFVRVPCGVNTVSRHTDSQTTEGVGERKKSPFGLVRNAVLPTPVGFLRKGVQ